MQQTVRGRLQRIGHLGGNQGGVEELQELVGAALRHGVGQAFDLARVQEGPDGVDDLGEIGEHEAPRNGDAGILGIDDGFVIGEQAGQAGLEILLLDKTAVKLHAAD